MGDVATLFQGVKAWAEQPFRGAQNMDAGQWIAFVFFILGIFLLWQIVLNHIGE